MMRITTQDGRQFLAGDYIDAAEGLRGHGAFVGPDVKDLRTYINGAAHRLQKMTGIKIEVRGRSIDERCLSFITQLVNARLLTMELVENDGLSDKSSETCEAASREECER